MILPLLLATSLALAPTAPLPGGSRTAPAPGFQRYVVDAGQSEVGFNGSSTLHDFVGRSRAVRGELHADPQRLPNTAGGQLLLAVSTLDTDSDGRNEEMLDTMEVERYPDIVLTVDSLSGPVEHWRGQPTARVSFDIHGIRRSHTLPVTLSPMGSHGFLVSGELGFSIEDHDLDPPGFLFVSMDSQVKVWFDVALRPLQAETLPGQQIPITWSELTRPLGGQLEATDEFQPRQEQGRLWLHDDGLIWERQGGARWLWHSATDSAVIALAEVTRHPSGPSAEESFGGMPLRRAQGASGTASSHGSAGANDATGGGSENAVVAGPPRGELQLQRHGDEVEITLAGEVWARLSGLSGEAAFGSLLGSLPGVPAAVASALDEIHGLPRRFFLRTVTPAGSSRMQGSLGEPRQINTPDWYWTPSAWTSPSPDPAPALQSVDHGDNP